MSETAQRTCGGFQKRESGPGAVLGSEKPREGEGARNMFLYRLGRFLQVVGLIVAPAGIAGELLERLTLQQSLHVALAGAAIFFLGRYLCLSSGVGKD